MISLFLKSCINVFQNLTDTRVSYFTERKHITGDILLKLCLRLFLDLPLLVGVTVAGYGNGTSGSTPNALTYPLGLALDVNDSLYVSDYGNHRVMKIQAGSLTRSVVADSTGVSGDSLALLNSPAELAVDANSNIYVNDDFNYRVMLWRADSSSGVIVAGNGSNGSAANTIGESVGLALDSQGNIYVSDKANNRVMKWAPNATSGILVAGTGVAGSSSQQLYNLYGLHLDENNSYLYVADLANSRIQRYSLDDATNGTTVAGGNGAGSGSNQLNQPYGICVSKQTGDIYIADFNNNRIQRWSPEATSGITIVGITGVSGTNATLLNGPANVLLDKNETFLYVSDRNNHRVQRFNLT
jgi:sugar lactone lactonase YvrE